MFATDDLDPITDMAPWILSKLMTRLISYTAPWGHSFFSLLDFLFSYYDFIIFFGYNIKFENISGKKSKLNYIKDSDALVTEF